MEQQYNEFEEIGYEGTIAEESGGFALLPEGDYDFTITKVTRGRFEGSAKMPACNSVTVELTIWGPQDKTVISERFFLVRKFEWKLSQFFLSIGVKKHGEPLVMRWNIEGMKGKCKVYVDTYKKDDGTEGKSNKAKKFYAYDEDVQTVSPQPAYSQPAQTYQQTPVQYQQSVQQYQAPQNQPYTPPQTPGGLWQAGTF